MRKRLISFFGVVSNLIDPFTINQSLFHSVKYFENGSFGSVLLRLVADNLLSPSL